MIPHELISLERITDKITEIYNSPIREDFMKTALLQISGDHSRGLEE